MTAARAHRQSGFTLVEVIISLFIFSLIATSALYATRVGLSAGEQVERADSRLAQMQRARLIIREDLLQALARPVRDEFGTPATAPMLGGTRAREGTFNDEERLLLRFVRGGWENPDYVDPRPEVQFVTYLVRGTELIRRTGPFLDAA